MAKDLVQTLKESMEHADDWDKRKTPIPGIFVVRVPDKKLRLKLEFNTPDSSGNPTKRRGMYFEDMQTVDAAKEAFGSSKLKDLVNALSVINKGRVGSNEPEEEKIDF